MLRSLLLALLALATLVEASAQTTPTTTAAKRSTAAKRTVKRTPAKKAAVKKKTTRTATKMGTANKTTQPNGSNTDQSREDIKPRPPGEGQGVYAAPGMAVKPAPSANAGNYRGEAPKTNPRQGNTLGTPAKAAPTR